jgi:hypothetical protein
VQRILTIVPGLLFLLAETIAGFDPPPSVSSAPSRERHRFAEDLSAMRELANESAQAASYWPRPERVRLARFPAAAPLSRFTCS